MTPGGPPADLLTSGPDDDPLRVARQRRRWRRWGQVAALVVGVLAAAALLTGRFDLWLPGGAGSEDSPLPPEHEDALLVLDPQTETSTTADLPEGPLVVKIECLGPGAVLVRLEGKSYLQAKCVPGALNSISERVRRAYTAGDKAVLVSASTVTSPSRDLHWRVTVHPARGAPAG